jgi:hypothetical protein
MKFKKLVPTAALVLGIAVISFSVVSMERVAKAKGIVNVITEPLSDSPYGSLTSTALHNKASEYDSLLRYLLIAGVALTLAGTVLVF